MLYKFSLDTVSYPVIKQDGQELRRKFVPGEYLESDESPEVLKELGFVPAENKVVTNKKNAN